MSSCQGAAIIALVCTFTLRLSMQSCLGRGDDARNLSAVRLHELAEVVDDGRCAAEAVVVSKDAWVDNGVSRVKACSS